MAFTDIKGKDGKILVEKDRRISMRHIRQIEKSGLNTLTVPAEYLLGKIIGEPIVNTCYRRNFSRGKHRNDRRITKYS